MFEVVRAFPTKNQKFKVGDRLYRSMDLSPHTIDTLIACGYVENRLDDAVAPASAKEKTPK